METSWLSIYSAGKHSLPKKTLSFKKRHSWGREWKIEEVLPVQTSRFCELYWTFLKISVSLSREDKRGSHLGSLQKFCNIFFFTSLPNKSILSNALSMTLSLTISSLVSAVDRRTQRADYCTFICHEWTTRNSKVLK